MKKYLKKLTAVFLVCAMLAVLAACDNTNSTSSAASSAGETSSAAVSSETGAAGGDASSAGAESTASSEAGATSSEAASSEEPVSSTEPTPIEHVMKGTIEDSTMNTFVLKTNEGSITFTIGPDTNLSNMPDGLKIGDKVSVLYTGNVEGTDGSGVTVTRVNPIRE